MEFRNSRVLLTSDNSTAMDTVVSGLILALKEKNLNAAFLMYELHLEKIRFFQGLLGKNIRVISERLMLPQLMVSEIALAGSSSDITVIVGTGDINFDSKLADKLMMPLVVLKTNGHNHSLVCGDDIIAEFALEHTFTLPSYFSQSKPNSVIISRSDLILVKDEIIRNLDFNLLLRISETASEIKLRNVYDSALSRARIAVASDPCFSLMIPNNLELLKYFGAEIVVFSPLIDRKLPKDIGGLYLPGGYLTEYGGELAQNQELYTDIRRFYKAGGSILTEGAGTAFLCNQFSASTTTAFQGIGILAARAKLNSQIKIQVYDSETLEDTILGGVGTRYTFIHTNEFKYTFVEDVIKLARVNSTGDELMLDGISPGAQCFLSQGFINFASNPRVAREFVFASTVGKF